MGNMIHIATEDTEEAEESVFVIPRSIYFTPTQMAAMIDAGQQPGVPFRIGGDGAQRPSRPLHRTRVVKNMAALDKSSFVMEIDENGRFTVRFFYDAVEEVSLYIYFGVRDTSSNKYVSLCSPESSHLQWGPYSLGPGVKQEWSSARQQLYGDPKCLVCGGGGLFDAIVVLDHSATSSSPRGQKKSRFLSYGGGDGEGRTDGQVGEDTPKKRQQKGAEACVVRHASYFVIKPTPQSFVRVRLQASSSAESGMDYAADVAVSHSGRHNRSKRKGSSRGGRPEGHSSDGEPCVSTIAVKSHFQGPLALSCTMQKIQMRDGGIFLVQNVYGMDRGPAEEGGGGEGVDTDAAECVICLTEEKEVVVYPCRHMCMCLSCAEALPSQNNNCPICRRPVTLLLRLRAYGKGATGQQTTGDARGSGLSVAGDGKGIDPQGNSGQNGHSL